MQKFVLPIITLIATLAIATEAKALPSEEFLKGATYQGVHKLIDDSNLSLEDKLTALSLVEHAPNTAFNNVDLYCFYKRKGLTQILHLSREGIANRVKIWEKGRNNTF
jgi:hypothetical protein